MQGYEASTYGDRMVDHDAIGWPVAKDEEAAVAFLLDVAKPGQALELGVGTGRVAIPLARNGVRVTGIEASDAMLRQLADKPEGAQVRSVRGDFADVAVDGPFDLVYAVQHTFFLLRTQDDQLRCFQNAAARLAPGGALVLQLFVPDPHRLIKPQSTDPLQVALDQVVLRVSQFDRVEQTVTRQYIAITETGTKLYPMVFRYAWPAELDLMARMAGLQLEGRWNGWSRAPFTAEGSYVVVYRKP
ncbi:MULTISPECIES: class I SAM-dependent methyltransferase [Streptomyces violaceusniger group]|uniref:Class I SAM-dependent methyltransferase n=2 Tax=Streptomyces javensis TaxID=114698 RepID=A0ABP4I0F8_9ACTN|nr:class I SAM-dependent methyltransferase [Streptomyces javensis]MBI0318528.1 methyltransferase domain-containing protein [Streptomyces javensis]